MFPFICPRCRRLTEKLETYGNCEHCGHSAMVSSGVPVRPGEPLPKSWDTVRRRAAWLLFAIAALQLVCGGVLVMLASSPGRGLPEDVKGLMVAEWLGVTTAFAALGWLALYQPLPAASIGLGLYLILALATLVSNPRAALVGLPLRAAICAGLIAIIVSLMRKR